MASITPRASGLWTQTQRMSYFEGNGDEDLEGLLGEGGEDDGRTPLDKTIDRIGMGSYQWTLLSLCGFGWLADNMWIQAVAIILPRVQRHYDVGDQFIGNLSASMFAGMMFGAVGWGTCSDLLGRTAAFNATLFLTAIFGALASFTSSFTALCFVLFLLGSAVGGSMPTDGTLLLEHMPNGKQYLVTALSVFFSFGAVLAAVVALILIPGHSCTPGSTSCDVNTENRGWGYLLLVLGIITLCMFLARMVFFRLYESPRYLVHAGRPQEAVEALQLISRFNGSELSLSLDDVADHRDPTSSNGVIPSSEPNGDSARILSRHIDSTSEDAEVLFEAGPQPADDNDLSPPSSDRQSLRRSFETEPKDYNATGKSDAPLESHKARPSVGADGRPLSFYSIVTSTPLAADPPIVEQTPISPLPPLSSSPPPLDDATHISRPIRTRAPLSNRQSRRMSTASSLAEIKSTVYWNTPRWIRKPFCAWLDRVGMVMSPEWARTTVLVWAVWCTMSLAYTMFNVYLPKLLETRSGLGPQDSISPKSLTDSLWDVVIYAVGGCPGAIVGAYLVDTRLGRRWSLAGSTFVTAFFCIMFVTVQHPWAVRASTVGISLSATTMWAVLYGWTPEIFGTKVRGTACGIASALSRIGGMIAPILGGSLLMVDSSFPVYASIVIFLIAGVCVLLLREDEGDRSNGGATLMH